MNRGIDCVDITYEVTFNSTEERQLTKLMSVLEGLLPKENLEVHTSGNVTSFIITAYGDWEDV